MPETFFTAAPHWRWLIVLYFFIGGIAGGSFALAALLDLFGTPQDRPIVRTGYYVACLGAVISGMLLTADLGHPERFWHMLIQSERGLPMFKYWSPMSVGAWGLMLFGGFAVLATLGTLHETGRMRWTLLQSLHGGVLGSLIAVLGSLCGFLLAGYTGALLSVTNRPLWGDTTWLGLLFLSSGTSTAAALLMLLGLQRGVRPSATVHHAGAQPYYHTLCRLPFDCRPVPGTTGEARQGLLTNAKHQEPYIAQEVHELARYSRASGDARAALS